MHKDREFAEAISKLGQEIAKTSRDTIKVKDFEAKDNAVVIGKAEANTQFFGGSHVHPKKN